MRSLFVICAPWCALLSAGPWSAAAGADWVDERTVDIFRLRSEFDLSDAEGEELLDEIRGLRPEIERLLQLEANSDPVEVNLFANRRSYQKFLAVRVPDGAGRAALYVKGTDMGRVYVYRHRGFATDVRHECTHAILHNALPYVPLWLDEGLAEYFEAPAPLRARSNAHLQGVRWATRLGSSLDLESLEANRDLSEMSAEDYRDSWAWVHFLLHGPLEARQVLSNYLYEIRAGSSAGPLSNQFERQLPGVQSMIVQHFRTWK